MEDVLERSLHSLRSYLYWAKQQKRIGEKKQQTMLASLKQMKTKLSDQRTMLNSMIDNQVGFLTVGRNDKFEFFIMVLKYWVAVLKHEV